MRLRVALEQILAERDLDKVTADQYRRAELRFSEWLGKAADSVDLTVANVNNWIMHLQQKVCGTTARGTRSLSRGERTSKTEPNLASSSSGGSSPANCNSITLC